MSAKLRDSSQGKYSDSQKQKESNHNERGTFVYVLFLYNAQSDLYKSFVMEFLKRAIAAAIF